MQAPMQFMIVRANLEDGRLCLPVKKLQDVAFQYVVKWSRRDIGRCLIKSVQLINNTFTKSAPA